MAKIRPAGKRKEQAGPKNPGAVGCVILLGLVFVVVCVLLYYSIAR